MNDHAQLPPGFFIVPFDIDGESLGTGFWPLSKLSPHWLEFCQNYFTTAGSAFDTFLPGKLSRIRVKYTPVASTALLSIFVGERLLSSSIILSGGMRTMESDAIRMFLSALSRNPLTKSETQLGQPFATLLETTERPLMGVIHWPDDSVDGEADELARELALHFAGAFVRAL